MTDKTISFTITTDDKILRATSDMLLSLTSDFVAFDDFNEHDAIDLTQCGDFNTDFQPDLTQQPAVVQPDLTQQPAVVQPDLTQQPAVVQPDLTQQPAVVQPDLTQQPAVVELGLSSTGNLIPWDVRIHSSARTKNKDGKTWKLKRSLTPDILSSVENELLLLMAVPSITPSVNQNKIYTFPELLVEVSSKVSLGVITEQQKLNAVANLGLTSFINLSARPDLIPVFIAELGLFN